MQWKQRIPITKPKGRDDIVARLAKIRGIDDLEDFLYPKSSSLYSPYMFKNIEAVAKRIKEAIVKNEKVCISTDPDTDGITSTSMLYLYLGQFTDNVYYTYHQRSSGHGVENQIKFIEDDTDLLIILDSSTNSVKACKELSEKGIEIIILDHHEFEEENPYATIVNPQMDNYPNKSISGAGVTFKTMQVIDELLGIDTAFEYIDLCAIGMYGDMMNVSVPENRYIITEGMHNIKNEGLIALLNLNNVDLEEVNSTTIGFKISPFLNGSARLDKIELALQLLTSGNEMECALLAREMSNLNEARKTKEKELVDKYMTTINTDNKVIIAIDKQASKGFNGLVATKLSKEFKRPSMVLRDHKGTLAGSYRNYGDFDMKKFLRGCKVVQSAEGHSFAGGVTINKCDYEEFLEYVNTNLENQVFEQVIEYDLEILAKDVTKPLIEQINRFNHLVGQGLPKAIFKVKDLLVSERSVIGKNKDTVKIVCDELTALKFKVNSEYAKELEELDIIDVVGELTINEWRNWRTGVVTVTNQVLIEDYIVKEIE